MSHHSSSWGSSVRWVLAGLAWGLAAAAAWANDEIPAKPQDKPIALIGGTVHTVSGPTLAGGVVVFDQGKITGVYATLESAVIPADAARVDVAGKHVFPGMIDASTIIGLEEIGSVRATQDASEMGELNPSAKAATAINPDSEHIPTTRSNGVLLTLSVPQGGTVLGQSALIQLDGWTVPELTVKSPVGLHLAWPRMLPVRSWREEDEPEEQVSRRDEQLQAIDQAFADARAYALARKASEGDGAAPVDLRWEAMQPMLRGELPLVVHADELTQIQAAVAFAARHKVRLILHGGADAPLCAMLLRQHDVPVIYTKTHRLPQRRDDDPATPFSAPARLHQAGVRFCLGTDDEPGFVRNLPYQAGSAVAHGLPEDVGLRSVTLAPAQILGVGDRLGSLEVGKDATLVVASGHPLEIMSQIEQCYVQGRDLALNDRHKRLYEKYRQRPRLP